MDWTMVCCYGIRLGPYTPQLSAGGQEVQPDTEIRL